jgi:signal transduction histidine kinase
MRLSGVFRGVPSTTWRGGLATLHTRRRTGKLDLMRWARTPIWGLELFGVAIAGLTLVGSVVTLVVYGDIFLLNNLRGAGNGLARGLFAVAAVVVVVPLGLPRALTAMRRLANLTRGLSRDWCGVAIAEPYPPVAPGEGRPGSWAWSLRALGQSATWRDMAWMFVAPVACPLLLMPLAAPSLLGWYLAAKGSPAPPPDHGSLKLSILVALSVATLGAFLAGPWLLRLYGQFARSLLGPTTQAELTRRVRHLAETRSESLDSSAAELRRIERDLHDGAQARLVALGMTLGALEGVIGSDEASARALVVEAQASSAKALSELRDLVRGIHPPVLADRGLVDAVRALALDSPLPVDVSSELAGRPPPPVESAVYFAISELLTNTSKHASATRAWVELRYSGGALRARVSDNGRGGADPGGGTGLRGIERRIAAFDGVLAVISPLGGPTVVNMEVPCELSLPKISSS